MTSSESQALGACLAFPADAIPAARRLLTAEDFSTPAGRGLCATACDLWDAHRALDLPMLSDALTARGLLEAVGGDARLTGLYDAVGTAATVPYHARRILEEAARRRLRETLAECAEEAARDSADLDSLRARVADRIARACTIRRGAALHSAADLAAMLEGPSLLGIPSGLDALDRARDGLQAEDFIVIAGRPGIGKTSLGLQVSHHVTRKEGVAVLFVSCEMSPPQIARWFAALVGGLTRSAVGPASVATIRGTVAGLPFYVTAPSAPTIGQVQAGIRSAAAAHEVKVAIVDHIGKLRAPGAENRTQEVGTVARGLKGIAKESGVTVIGLCQLSRAIEHRDGGRPQLSDLRDSGEVEQEADVVAFLWTEETQRHKADLKVKLTLEKVRDGAQGETVLVFRRPLGRFEKLPEKCGEDDLGWTS